MQFLSVNVLTLVLAITLSNGLSIVKQGATVNVKADVAARHLVNKSIGKQLAGNVDPILVRPNAGKGVDKVNFGLRAMNFYGADLKHFIFAIDLVMTIKWKDPRVIALIPEGLDKLSMSWRHAERLMWMPGVVVSNRDIDKYEIISASVTVYRSGDVRRVERANCRVMKKFALEGYPFDAQDLTINVASSKYMLDEVELVPDMEAAGVEEDLWGVYNLEGWSAKSYTTTDGDLVKSRGTLNIKVVRSLSKYSQDHLMPAFIVLMISGSVFWFPFANPFITARLALSILALLQFTNLMVKSSKELPGSAPFNWNDLFNQQIQTLMFITIVLNIASEVCFHQFQNEPLARDLNREAKFLMPLLSVINIVLILGGCKYHWMTMHHAIIVTKVVLAVLMTAYIAHATCRELQRQGNPKNQQEIDVAAEQEKLAQHVHFMDVANYKKRTNQARSSVV